WHSHYNATGLSPPLLYRILSVEPQSQNPTKPASFWQEHTSHPALGGGETQSGYFRLCIPSAAISSCCRVFLRIVPVWRSLYIAATCNSKDVHRQLRYCDCFADEPRAVHNFLTDWAVGAEGGDDLWVRAERLIRRRRSDEIDGEGTPCRLVPLLTLRSAHLCNNMNRANEVGSIPTVILDIVPNIFFVKLLHSVSDHVSWLDRGYSCEIREIEINLEPYL
ncbi:hypothetical protein C8R46DRAFT_1087654, partial [Mycena filopes]